MKTIELENGHTVTLYASCEELPAYLHSKYQCYLMQDAGIGSTMDDVGTHFEKLMAYCGHGMIAEAREEAANLYFNAFSILNGVNHKGLAMACLMHSIDDRPITDYSKEGIKQIYSELESKGITVGQIEDMLNEVKKKFSSELKVRFPKWFNNAEDGNLNLLFLKKLRLEIDYAVSGNTDLLLEVNKLEKEILTSNPPKNFTASEPGNAITLWEKEFQGLCAQLESNGISQPYKLPVVELYSKIEFLEKKSKKHEQSN